MIVSSKKVDAEQLTEIALKSKAFWGYSNELIDGWRNDLTVSAKMISECAVYHLMSANKAVGFYVLNPPENNNCELEMLFVLPDFVGKGIGKCLIEHAFIKAQQKNAKSITLLADPNAVPFYRSQGFEIIDKKESSIAGRFLPIMKKCLI